MIAPTPPYCTHRGLHYSHGTATLAMQFTPQITKMAGSCRCAVFITQAPDARAVSRRSYFHYDQILNLGGKK